MNETERMDDLQNGYYILQEPNRFCFGVDAVLLSDFASKRKINKAIDLGTGTGIIPILMAAKAQNPEIHITGLEIQSDSAELAERSVKLNELEDKIRIVCGDIKEASEIFGEGVFDTVTSNPPYMINDHGLKNEKDAMTIARHEVLCSFDDIVRETAKLLKDKGHCYFIHRPFRLAELMGKMSAAGLEPKRMRLIYPYVDKEPTMVLLEGVKGAKSNMIVEPPLIIHEKDGDYTDEIYQIYGKSRK